MQLKDLKESMRDANGNEIDFHWDDDRFGYYVTVNGQEIPDSFFKAKSQFDRIEAQEAAKKVMVQLRSDAAVKKRDEDYRRYQYDKPLTDLEKEWLELSKKFNSSELDNKGLDRWSRLGQEVIRKSLHDGTHPLSPFKK